MAGLIVRDGVIITATSMGNGIRTVEKDDTPGDAVCAVLITYEPDLGLASRVQRITAQVGAMVIVDNGSAATCVAMLRDLAHEPGVASNPDAAPIPGAPIPGATTLAPHVALDPGRPSTSPPRAATSAPDVASPPRHASLELIENDRNLGVATALNMGMDFARRRGFQWAVLFDQDSLADEDMVEQLLRIRDACSRSWPLMQLAVVGSGYRDTGGRPARPALTGRAGPGWIEVESAITSGALVALDAYAAVGAFRDEFFIDYVDTEYCFRARANGYHVVQTERPLMSHTVGAPTSHRLLGKRKWTTNHSAERRYYIARNDTIMLREYGVPGGGSWRRKSLLRCVRLCKRILLYETDKSAKILAVWQGWRDAVHGKLGPRPP